MSGYIDSTLKKLSTDPDELPALIYHPLAAGQIRVLVPNLTDGLSWTLEVSSNTDLTFDAFSYCWGPQTETFAINCNGHQLRVHHNLYTALPYLARRQLESTPAQAIWIDAVCINQADDDEKLIQIGLMNQIYTKARKVWAWLGLAKDQSYVPHILSLLPQITAYNAAVAGVPRHLKPERPAELQELSPVFWETVLHLFRNPWFERVWVVQEAALAKDITFLCGEHELSFAILSKAAADEAFTKWDLQEQGKEVDNIAPAQERHGIAYIVRNLLKDKEDKLHDHQGRVRLLKNPLHAISIMADNLKCFAPQDRILGALALLKEMDPYSMHDYGSNSTAKLYIRFSQYILSTSVRDFRWWRYINSSFGLMRTKELPSWVPDLHHQISPHVCHPNKDIAGFCHRDTTPYQASTLTTAFATGNRLDEIALRARVVDEIGMVHPMIPKMLEPTYYYDTKVQRHEEAFTSVIEMVDWETTVAEAALIQGSGENKSVSAVNTSYGRVTIDTYWRTFLRDEGIDGEIELNEATWHDVWDRLREMASLLRKSRELLRYADITS